LEKKIVLYKEERITSDKFKGYMSHSSFLFNRTSSTSYLQKVIHDMQCKYKTTQSNFFPETVIKIIVGSR